MSRTGTGVARGGRARHALALLACAALAGCGVAGTGKHFDAEGFGITFDYPYTLTEKVLTPDGSPDDGAVGSEHNDKVVRELTLTDDDFIAVRRDPTDARLIASGMAALQPSIDQLAKVLDPNAGTGRAVTIGGMPGLEYEDAGPDVQHRFLFFAGPDVLYLVHCRSTPAHRVEISEACATVERTLRRA